MAKPKYVIMPMEYEVKLDPDKEDFRSLFDALKGLGLIYTDEKGVLKSDPFTIIYEGTSLKSDIAEYHSDIMGVWRCENRKGIREYEDEELERLSLEEYGKPLYELNEDESAKLIHDHYKPINLEFRALQKSKEKMLKFCNGEIYNDLDFQVNGMLEWLKPHLNKPELERYFPGDATEGEPDGESKRSKSAKLQKRDRHGKFVNYRK